VAANFKGTVFESTRMFTERQFGADGVAKVLAQLSPEDRLILSNVQAIGWYPVEPVLRYHHALDRTFGKGDFALCTAAGKFSATWSMNTVLKVFLRFKSPTWLIDKATRVWGRYHDTGRWEVASPAPHRLVGTLSEYAVKDVAFCARLRGWLQGAVEATGGVNASITETRCACRGHESCVFLLSWGA
jgi:V4R domain